jgi:hypothetical protein
MLGKYPRFTVMPVPPGAGVGVVLVVVLLVTPQALGTGVLFPLPPQAESIHAKTVSNRREERRFRQDTFIKKNSFNRIVQIIHPTRKGKGPFLKHSLVKA